MSAQVVQVVRKRLAASNDEWPRAPKPDKHAEILEHRLARALGDREIVFATAAVEGVRGTPGPRRYAATLLTEEAVLSGELAVDKDTTYPPPGNVRIIPRTAIRSLTVHHVELGEPEIVSFTALFEGLEPLQVWLPRHGWAAGGGSGSLFDLLRADLFSSSLAIADRG